MYKKLKITVKTPKGQAGKCMKNQKNALLGYKISKKIIEEDLINDRMFYYVIPVESNDEVNEISKRLSMGENMIKTFYKQLYKVIKKVNRIISLSHKFGKIGYKAIPYVIKKIKKYLIGFIPDKEQREKMIEHMEEEINNCKFEKDYLQFIVIDDQEEMDELLSGDLIKIDIIEDMALKCD